MEAVQKESTIHIQHQIRNHAEEVKNTLNDLYSWEKEMKDKELRLKNEKELTDECFQPVRSHVSTMKDLEAKAENITKSEPGARGKKQNNVELADGYKELGNKYVKLGEYEKAVSEYTAAIAVFDRNPKLYTNRALCYLKLKRYDECIRDCNDAIDIDNLTVKAYYRRMQASECLGLYTDALKDCSTVLMIDSKNIDAKKSLQRINERLKATGGDTKCAVLSQGPSFSPLRSNLVDILPFNKPSYSRSKKSLKKANIIDVVGSKDGKNFENSAIQISDEVIEKLFNGECGAYEEVKKSSSTLDKAERDVLECDSNKNSLTKPLPPPQKMKATASESISVPKKKTLPESPKSTAQFYCNWKELTSEMKYQYFKSIPLSQLNKMLGAGFDSETLSDLLKVLKEFYLPANENICEVLLHISKHDGLPILSLLLSAEDREVLIELLDHINETRNNIDHIAQIRKSFNLE